MGCTIKDVAKLAGTSTATVSLVVNNKPGVKPSTKEKVLDAIEKLNYKPNLIARNLVSQKTDTIAFIVTDISNPFYSRLAYEMQQIALKRGYSLLLGISNNEPKEEERLIKFMISRGVAGILLVPCTRRKGTQKDLGYIYECRLNKIPLVFVTDKYIDVSENCVVTDYKTSMCELTNYFINAGLHKIVFFCDGTEPYYSLKRIEGYIQSYKEHNLPYDPQWIVDGNNADARTGRKYTKELILPMKPDGIICVNAISALGVMSTLQEKGIKVPEEMSVACFDELDYNDILYSPLTYVSQNIKEICNCALERMEEIISGDTDINEILIPGKLCIRKTSPNN